MGRKRTQPNERSEGVCVSCHRPAPIIASDIFPEYCPTCYKREYAWRHARMRGIQERANFWTDAECEIVRQQFGAASRWELLLALPGRSWKSIKHKALELGVVRGRDAEYRAIIADEPTRADEYWQQWADSRAQTPTHPAIAELISAERRILRTLH